MNKHRYGICIKRILTGLAIVAIILTAQGFQVNAESADNDLINRCSSYHGWEDIEKRSNSQGRQALYEDIRKLSISIWNSSSDIDWELGYYVLGKIDYGIYGLSNAEAIEVYYTFKNDNPLFYYLSSTIAYKNDYLWIVTGGQCADGEARQNYQNDIEIYLNEMVKYLGELTSPYVIAEDLHEVLNSEISYAYTNTGRAKSDILSHSIVGAISFGEGVCEAYARTYQLVLNYLQQENIFITGQVSGGDHAWNLVQLDDGEYYYVDCTWDDANGNWTYFAVGTEDISNHTPDTPNNRGVTFLYDLPLVPKKSFIYEAKLRGDVNNDGDFNMKDYSAMEMYLNGWNIGTDHTASDLNEDGMVNMKDKALLQQLLNGWNV